MATLMRSLLLLALLSFAVCQKTTEGTAAHGDRDIPIKSSEITGSEGQEYAKQLIIQSGGVGIGLGLIFTICMFFHLCCWGFCCNFCRCCCFRKDKIREQSCWQRKNRKGPCIAAIIILLIAAAGVAVIFSNQATTFSKIDTLFDNTLTTVRDAEDFICSGNIPTELRSGSSLDTLKANYGGTSGVVAQCGQSVGKFMADSNSLLNATFLSILSIVDTSQNIITSLNSTISSLDNALPLTVTLNETVINMTSESAVIRSKLDALHTSSSGFSGYIPVSSLIPNTDSNDLAGPTIANIGIVSASDQLKSSRNEVLPTIKTDLDVTIRASVNKQWGAVIKVLVNIDNTLLKGLDQLVGSESQITDANDQIQSYEYIGSYIMAAIYSISFIFLLLMLVGYTMKSTCCMCCGGYLIFFTYIWLALILGIFLVLSMLVYDVCGCEGTYTAAGCVTLNDIIKENIKGNMSIGDGNFNLQATVTDIITCPVNTDAAGSYVHTSSSNFVDILGILNTFNFTSELQEPINQLNDAFPQLNQTASLNSARSGLNLAANRVAMISVGPNYDFANDTTRYNFLYSELNNPTTAPSYYPTPPPSGQLNTDIADLQTLITTNEDMRIDRNLLNSTKFSFNASVDSIRTAIDGIEFSLDTTTEAITNSTVHLNNLRDFILTANQYTPCGWVGKAYSSIIITDFCQNLYTTVDGVVPGAILCMASMLLGFFLLVMMRDCVRFQREENRETGYGDDMKMAMVANVQNIDYNHAQPNAIMTSGTPITDQHDNVVIMPLPSAPLPESRIIDPMQHNNYQHDNSTAREPQKRLMM